MMTLKGMINRNFWFFLGGGGFYDPSSDPSNRRDVSLTVEFTVTNEEFEDDTEPWYLISNWIF
jgi:hypothetical protein